MHSSPTDETKVMFIDQGRKSIYSFGFLSTFILMLGNFYFVISRPEFLPYGIYVLTTAFYLSLSYLVGFMGKDFNYEAHKNILEAWK